jgi:hypothetical protein
MLRRAWSTADKVNSVSTGAPLAPTLALMADFAFRATLHNGGVVFPDHASRTGAIEGRARRAIRTMTRATSGEQVREYVQGLTPQVRGRLLDELERLHLAGEDIEGSEVLLTELRTEFRGSGRECQKFCVRRPL